MFKNVLVCLVITFNKKIIQVEKQNGQTYFNIFNIFIETSQFMKNYKVKEYYFETAALHFITLINNYLNCRYEPSKIFCKVIHLKNL